MIPDSNGGNGTFYITYEELKHEVTGKYENYAQFLFILPMRN